MGQCAVNKGCGWKMVKGGKNRKRRGSCKGTINVKNKIEKKGEWNNGVGGEELIA